MSKLDEIKRIKDLLDGEFITREEFEKLKGQILGATLNEPSPKAKTNLDSPNEDSTTAKDSTGDNVIDDYKSRTKYLADSFSIRDKENSDSQENKTDTGGGSGNNHDIKEKGNQLLVGGILLLILVLSIASYIYFNNYYQSNKSDNLNGGDNLGASNNIKENTSGSISSIIDTCSNCYPGSSNNGSEDTASSNITDIDRVKGVLNSYFEAMTNGNFNASDYFSPSVEKYIKLRNTDPYEINNSYENSKSEFVNSHTDLIDNTLSFERAENGIDYYTFKINFSTYRKSLKKQETCLITLEVGYDASSKKLTSYNEMKIEDLKFESSDLQRANVGNENSNKQISKLRESVKIGQVYEGGIVAYVYKPSDKGYVAGETHGIIISPYDISESENWEDANKICKNLAIDNYTDWQLPDVHELESIDSHLILDKKKTMANTTYWSREGNFTDVAYFHSFIRDYSDLTLKKSLLHVRAVRVF